MGSRHGINISPHVKNFGEGANHLIALNGKNLPVPYAATRFNGYQQEKEEVSLLDF
jgi:hypothetical protein